MFDMHFLLDKINFLWYNAFIEPLGEDECYRVLRLCLAVCLAVCFAYDLNPVSTPPEGREAF